MLCDSLLDEVLKFIERGFFLHKTESKELVADKKKR
jgi:hypothetical protein